MSVTDTLSAPSPHYKEEKPQRKPKHFYVYIMTNGPRSHVLYTGITGNLPRRVFEHKSKLYPSFTSRYNLTRLVYHEMFAYPAEQSPGRKKSKDGSVSWLSVKWRRGVLR